MSGRQGGYFEGKEEKLSIRRRFINPNLGGLRRMDLILSVSRESEGLAERSFFPPRWMIIGDLFLPLLPRRRRRLTIWGLVIQQIPVFLSGVGVEIYITRKKKKIDTSPNPTQALRSPVV